MNIEAIKQARKAKGITQQDMAKYMNMARETYNRVEQGYVKLEDLERVCSRLDLCVVILPNSVFK